MILPGSAMFSLCLVLALVPAGRADDLSSAARAAVADGAVVVMDPAGGKVFALAGGGRLGLPHPAGSLLKLFTTCALLESGAPAGEVYYCPASPVTAPATKSCWYKPGHGNLTLTQALAFSCNAWFRQWLQGRDCAPALALYRKLGLLDGGADPADPAAALCGFTTEIRPTPLRLAAAAAALFNGGVLYDLDHVAAGERAPAVLQVSFSPANLAVLRDGMAESSRAGTGMRAGSEAGLAGALVKTGTAPHWLGERADPTATDGWCLVLYPAENPRLLILVLYPRGRGAEQAANAAAAILRAARDGEHLR